MPQYLLSFIYDEIRISVLLSEKNQKKKYRQARIVLQCIFVGGQYSFGVYFFQSVNGPSSDMRRNLKSSMYILERNILDEHIALRAYCSLKKNPDLTVNNLFIMTHNVMVSPTYSLRRCIFMTAKMCYKYQVQQLF